MPVEGNVNGPIYTIVDLTLGHSAIAITTLFHVIVTSGHHGNLRRYWACKDNRCGCVNFYTLIKKPSSLVYSTYISLLLKGRQRLNFRSTEM